MTGRTILGIVLFSFLLSCILLCGCTETMIESSQELNNGWSIYQPPSDVESLAVYDNIIYAGGKDGVYKIDPVSGAPAEIVHFGYEVTYVSSLLSDSRGNLWIGYNEGLLRCDEDICTLFTEEDGLSDKRVNALFEDKDGRILAGTWGGVSIYDDGDWSYITNETGLLDDMVNVIFEDSSGGLWFGSYVAPKGGVSYYKDGSWRYFTASDSLPHNNINAITEDSDGSVWIGTGLYDRGGALMLTYENNRWSPDQTILKSDGLAGEKVRSIYADDEGRIWFGSEYDGIAIMNNGSFITISTNEGLSDNEVKWMLADSLGSLWIGTHNGVTVISEEALKNI